VHNRWLSTAHAGVECSQRAAGISHDHGIASGRLDARSLEDEAASKMGACSSTSVTCSSPSGRDWSAIAWSGSIEQAFDLNIQGALIHGKSRRFCKMGSTVRNNSHLNRLRLRLKTKFAASGRDE
jgi:hypothetical protein